MNSPALNVLLDEIDALHKKVTSLESALERQSAITHKSVDSANQLPELVVPVQLRPLMEEIIKLNPKTREEVIRLIFFMAPDYNLEITPESLNLLLRCIFIQINNLVPVASYLTVGELQQKLANLPSEMPVFVDAELNCFSYFPLIWETQTEPIGTYKQISQQFPNSVHLMAQTDTSETIATLVKYTTAFNAFVTEDTHGRKAFVITPHY